MTGWLIDKSALTRLAVSPDATTWAERIQRGLVRISTVTRLEVGYSARSGSDLRAALQQPPLAAMPVEYLTPTIEDRAVRCRPCWPTVDNTGRHRSPDLLIAATAGLAQLTLLHGDKDFELIAELTDQAVERLRLAGDA